MNSNSDKKTHSNKAENPATKNSTHEGTTGKALQVNQNSNEATDLYEDKNAEILEKDAVDARKKQTIRKPTSS